MKEIHGYKFCNISINFNVFFLILVVLMLIFIWKKKGSETEKGRKMFLIPTWIVVKTVILLWMKKDNSFGVYLFQYLNSLCAVCLKEKAVRIPWIGKPLIICFHPDVACEILRSTKEINKSPMYDIMKWNIGNGLITSGGEKWRSRRKLLNSAFHYGVLEEFQHIFTEHSEILVKKLMTYQSDKEVDIKELIFPCTGDIFAESVMGMKINSQNESYFKYKKALKEIAKANIRWMSNPLFYISAVFQFSSLRKKLVNNIEICHSFTRNIIKKKKEDILKQLQGNRIENPLSMQDELGIKKRRVFLDLLIYHNLNSALTDEDVREEVDSFMTAGNETTAIAICWTLYFLGQHQDIQEKVHQELEHVLGNDAKRTITRNALNNMKYLDCVVKESLRLYPPTPFIIRKNYEEIHTGEYKISPGSSIVVNIYGIHHNPDVFKNPEIFDPERFNYENEKCREPSTFIPFSTGPRNCIGQRFAMMVIKTVCANIIRKFRVYSTQPRDQLLLFMTIVLTSKVRIKLLFENR